LQGTSLVSQIMGDNPPVNEVELDPKAEVRCEHVQQCGACPLMARRYADQRGAKLQRLERALLRYDIAPSVDLADVQAADPISGYRRRAKLVVARSPKGDVSVGLYRRHDNQSVVDIPGCKVLSPPLKQLVGKIREQAKDPPPELSCLLEPAGEGRGVLSGIDLRELCGPAAKGSVPCPDEPDGDATVPPTSSSTPQVLLTLVLVADRAASVEELREAGRALRRQWPQVAGVAVSLRYSGRGQGSSELVSLSGETECRDVLDQGYQLVSHTSFLHVHRGQSIRLYELLKELVSDAKAGEPCKVLDLYGGTGAIAISLAMAGHNAMLVESYPPAASLALRGAQAQRLSVEVVTGDVASVTRALAAASSKFDVVVANPPRRGLSPAARESVAGLAPARVLYVACDLDNLSRDLDHLARLGFQLSKLFPLDMLPLNEEVEVVALLERAPSLPLPDVLHQEEDLLALNKPPHEPVVAQPEYPGSLFERAKPNMKWDDSHPVLKIEAGTSGVALFARDEQSAERWADALARTGRLVYLAAARGVTPAKGAITRELRGEEGARPARTRYRRLAIGGGHSVLRVVPEKRHLHQIRRHLAAIGHPVLGDARYGHAPTNRYFEEKHGLDRSFLHLVRIELDHPQSGERLLIEAPLPPDLRATLVRASDESVLRFLENKRALGGGGVQLRPKQRPSPPASERSPLSVVETDVEGVYSQRPSVSGVGPLTVRGGRQPLDLDEAPRTVRGELLTPDED